MIEVKVQKQDFDVGEQYTALREKSTRHGAIVTFTGLVRDYSQEGTISSMFIEHYPGMTEKSLNDICGRAAQMWDLGHVQLIHRVGELSAAEQIVYVAVSSAHRKDAFEAAQFIMDFLKNEAPFWKKEGGTQGMKWVEAKRSDAEAAKRWKNKNT